MSSCLPSTKDHEHPRLESPLGTVRPRPTPSGPGRPRVSLRDPLARRFSRSPACSCESGTSPDGGAGSHVTNMFHASPNDELRRGHVCSSSCTEYSRGGRHAMDVNASFRFFLNTEHYEVYGY